MDLNNATVELGGASKLFLPNINSSRWGDECFLNLNYAKIESNKANFEVRGDRQILTQGNERLTIWPLNAAVLEASITYASQPTGNELRLRMLHSPSLAFWPQGRAYSPLLPGQLDGVDSFIPANVEGSFAVYHTKMHNQYQAGKFAHLYRWECIDANGQQAWCDPLLIDGEDLVIGLPVDWLSKAAYPVTAMGAGDTFGYTTGGANYENFNPGSHNGVGQLNQCLTAVSGDTITALHFFTEWAFAATCATKMAVYSGATANSTMNNASRAFCPSADIVPTSEYPTGAWESVSVNYALVGGTTYAVAAGDSSKTGSAEIGIWYDSGGSNSHSSQTSQALGTTWSEVFTNNTRYSLYATWSNVPSGVVIPVFMNQYRQRMA